MELIQQNWTPELYQEFVAQLRALGEEDYKKFNQKLTPDTPDMIGIRIPKLREIAKEISRGNAREFIALPKGSCHEEIILEGLVIGYTKLGFGELSEYIRRFAAKVYNWALCDIPVSSFKQIRQLLAEYLIEVDRFLHSENPWEQRIGIIILLDHYLTDDYIDAVLERIDHIDSDFYYVQMAQGWLVTTAFAEFRDKTWEYLNRCSLNPATLNLAVKKIRESNRVSKEDKDLALKLKR